MRLTNILPKCKINKYKCKTGVCGSAPAQFCYGSNQSMKRHKFKILSLLAVLALTMSVLGLTSLFAAAETTYTPTNIFSTSGASRAEDENYIAYNMDDGASIYYRKNLALKWYESDGEATYFSTVISFGDTYNFDSFTMTMETSEFSASKENKSVNTIEFTKGTDGALDVAVNGGTPVDVTEATVTDGEGADAKEVKTITVELRGDTNGSFQVCVNGDYIDDFTNIGMYYARYASSSADTPVTPLTFSVDLPDDAAEGTQQFFMIRELNGQSFGLNESGSVVDDKAPVLVVNTNVKLFILGSELDFDYVAIDVLDSSVSTTRYFYAFDEENPRVGFDVEGEETTYEQMDSDKRFFENDFPTYELGGEGYLSVAFRLSDGDNSNYYFIEWYVDDAALVEADGYKYTRVVEPGEVDDKPEYIFNDSNDPTGAQGWVNFYQGLVEEAAVTEDGESIQVGTGAYYYIPSLAGCITDATCGYTDMTFDLYWRTNHADTQSSTGLSYDELRIELTAEGVYEFRVVPINRLGNAIAMTDKNGVEVTSVTTENVWTINELHTFTFNVQYNGLTIEEPDDTEDGYIDATYTFDSFEIVSLSDDYTSPVTEYKLYYLVPNSEYEGRTIAMSDLRASLLSMDENGVCTYGTWTEITETDNEDEESDYAGSWDSSALSFVPKVSGYFGVTVRAYDDGINLPAKMQASVANISSRTDTLPGDTYWLQNNILSVVFICVGGACLIGIVVVLLIKPKDKRASAEGEGDAASDGKEDLKTKRKNRK